MIPLIPMMPSPLELSLWFSFHLHMSYCIYLVSNHPIHSPLKIEIYFQKLILRSEIIFSRNSIVNNEIRNQRYLPGHFLILHFSGFVDFPRQNSPFFSITVLFLVFILNPVSHVLEHCPSFQGPHSHCAIERLDENNKRYSSHC